MAFILLLETKTNFETSKSILASQQMDDPKTRRDKKKDQREKGSGKDGKYSTKHVRMMEAVQAKSKISK
jgi:hypothetical protein